MNFLIIRKHIFKHTILLLFVLLFYSILISIIPEFITDDYSILKIVKANGTLFSYSTNEKFYLYFRPVAYLSFWADVHLLSCNAIYSKIFSLILLIVTLVVIGSVVREFLKTSKKEVPGFYFNLTILLLCTNVNIVYSVIWVANRNEILMCLFYFLVMYFYLKYINTQNHAYLILIPFFFLLSILSKQQAIHLPFILLVIRYMTNKSNYRVYEKLMYFLLFLIMGIVIYINSYLIIANADVIIENIWKKGFWVINSLLYSFFPFAGDYLYNYFTIHKLVAAIIVSLLIFCLFPLKRYYIFKKEIILSSIIYLLTFFPIIVNSFSPRSIFLSFTVLIILLLYNVNISWGNILIKIFMGLIIVLNIFFSIKVAYDLNSYNSEINVVANSFYDNFKKNPTKTLVISSIENFEDRLNDNSMFTQDSLVVSLPIYPLNTGYYGFLFGDTNTLSVRYENGSIMMKTNSDDYCLSTSGQDTLLLNNIIFVITDKEKHRKKHLSSLTVKPLNHLAFQSKFKTLAILNGKNWNYINLNKDN